MNWDSIEVKWSEMARRALGDSCLSDAVGRVETGLGRILPDAGQTDAQADKAVRDAVEPLDRARA